MRHFVICDQAISKVYFQAGRLLIEVSGDGVVRTSSKADVQGLNLVPISALEREPKLLAARMVVQDFAREHNLAVDADSAFY